MAEPDILELSRAAYEAIQSGEGMEELHAAYRMLHWRDRQYLSVSLEPDHSPRFGSSEAEEWFCEAFAAYVLIPWYAIPWPLTERPAKAMARLYDVEPWAIRWRLALDGLRERDLISPEMWARL